MERKMIFFFLLIFVSTLYFNAAWAEEPAKSESPGYEAFDLGEIFVSTEKPPAVQDVAVTTVITEEEINATNSRTVAEALSYVPGIRVSAGYKDEPDIQIRGFGQSRNLILIDGVPYYETNYGKLDLNQIPVDNIAKIEITKGGSSVLYGPNALGGVINIITKKPTEKPSAGVLVEAGENGTYKASLSHGMKIGIFNYWLNYVHQESNGWRMSNDYEPILGTITRGGPAPPPPPPLVAVFEDGGFRNNSDFNQNAIWAKVGIEPEGGEYYLNFHYIERERPYPPKVDSVTVFTSRPAFSHFAELPRYDDWGIDLSGQQRIIDELTLKAKLFYHNHVDDFASYSDYNFSDEIAVSRYKDYLVGGALSVDYRPAKCDILRAALQYRRDSHKSRDDDYLPFEERHSYTGSVALENEFSPIKNFSLVTGVSYDLFNVTNAKRNITNKVTGDFIRQDALETPTMQELNPMIGATYTFSDTTRLFGSIAKKVRFPTLFQLYTIKGGGNVDLKAETSINYTLGISRNFGSYAKGELALFYYDVYDFIARPSADPSATLENYAKISFQGFELSGEVNPLKDLVLYAGYTYNKARDKTSNRITDSVVNVPEQKLDVGVKYTIPYIKTRLDLTGIYMGDVFAQLPTPDRPTQKVIQLADYFIMNLRVSKIFAKYFEAYVAVNNILDSDYEPESGFPAPGRNFYVGLAARY